MKDRAAKPKICHVDCEAKLLSEPLGTNFYLHIFYCICGNTVNVTKLTA